MSEILDLPVTALVASVGPSRITVAHVVEQVERALRKTENEPEWVTHANFIDEDCPDRFGLAPSAPWPDLNIASHRLSLSIERGNSEGWIICVDLIQLASNDDTEFWKSTPLIRIKLLNRSQAWAVAAVVSRLLDIG